MAKGVWLVRQTQPVDYYDRRTIYVCSTEEKAKQYCQELNKEYGYGVIFDREHNFVDFDDNYDYDDVHYYDYEYMLLDEGLSIFNQRD